MHPGLYSAVERLFESMRRIQLWLSTQMGKFYITKLEFSVKKKADANRMKFPQSINQYVFLTMQGKQMWCI